MVQINFATREVNCKIVYYGPGRGGKTTNLQVVHAKAPANSTGELVSIATETDRTLYFDFLPLDLGTVAGMRTKFQLYTVPGQVYYDATRKLVLQGCDGVVFVADSNPDLIKENIESLDNLAKNLQENGLDINEIPLVLQWNKRDLPGAMAVEDLDAKMNRGKWPTVPAVAINGDGVFQTLKAISQQVIRKLNRQQGYSEDGGKKPDRQDRFAAAAAAVAAAKAAPPPPPASNMPPPPPPPPAAKVGLPAAPPGSAARMPSVPRSAPPAPPKPERVPSGVTGSPPSAARLGAAPPPETPPAEAQAQAEPIEARAPSEPPKNMSPIAIEIAKRRQAEQLSQETQQAQPALVPESPMYAKSKEGVPAVVWIFVILIGAGLMTYAVGMFQGWW